MPGSIIWNNEWRAYQSYTQAGFIHQTVNHTCNFVNPIIGLHTQNLESLYNKSKRRLKAKILCISDTLPLLLKEWMRKDNISMNDLQQY